MAKLSCRPIASFTKCSNYWMVKKRGRNSCKINDYEKKTYRQFRDSKVKVITLKLMYYQHPA